VKEKKQLKKNHGSHDFKANEKPIQNTMQPLNYMPNDKLEWVTPDENVPSTEIEFSLNGNINSLPQKGC